jgi:hypothetical protein
MDLPDESCKHLDKCGELGKISDSCFQVNESKEQILTRMRSKANQDNPLRRDPSDEAILARLDLIDNELARIRTCLESLLTSRDKQP